MKEVSEEDYNVIKSYFQIQLLLESLDDLSYDSTHELKYWTNNYLNKLKTHAEPILNGMYKSNPEMYVSIMSDLRSGLDVMQRHFKILV